MKRLIKLTNLWQHSLKQRGKRSSKIRNEKEVTTDSTRLQRVLQGHYERLYDIKFNNVGEMGQFLEMYNRPGLNHKELENPNRPINSEETETTVKNFPKS